MPALSPLRIPIVGIDKFSNKLSKIQKRVNKFGRSMKKAGTVMTASITAPVALAGAVIFKSGYQFDKFMNSVQAKSTVAGKSIDDLRKKALDLGSSTSFSHIQAAEAMTFLAQAGYNTGQTFKAIQPTLNLATATNIELGQSADWLTNIMGGFQWGAERAGEAATILAVTTAKANVGMEDLSYTFADVGPIAKSYGATLKDVAAATGFLGNVGITGTKAGTALKNMFTNLSKQTPAATEALKKLGVQVDVNGKMRSYTDILTDLSGALGKVSQKQSLGAMATIFGKTSLAGVTALTTEMQAGNTQFIDLVKNLDSLDSNSLQDMVDIMRQGSVGAWDDMVSSIQGLGQAIADSGVVQMMSDFFKLVTKITRSLAKFSPAILKTTAIFAAIAAAVGPVLVVIGSLIPVITALAVKISAAGGVIALLSNPVGWVIAGIIALTAAVVLLWKQIKPLRDVIGSGLIKAMETLKPLLYALKRLFSALWDHVGALVEAFAPLAAALGITFGGEALTGLELLIWGLTKVIDLVTWAVKQFTKFTKAMAGITEQAVGMADTVKGFKDNVTGSVMGLGSSVLGKLGLGNDSQANTSDVTRLRDTMKMRMDSLVNVNVVAPKGTQVKADAKGAKVNTVNNGQIIPVGGL